MGFKASRTEQIFAGQHLLDGFPGGRRSWSVLGTWYCMASPSKSAPKPLVMTGFTSMTLFLVAVCDRTP
jgi:hypothetical protein